MTPSSNDRAARTSVAPAVPAAAKPAPGGADAAPSFERSRVINRLEQIITQDLVGRGLASDPSDNLVSRCRGQLARAAHDLAGEGNAVAIVTGFYVPTAAGPAIETDGPCGAIALGWLLERLGYALTLVTDPLGAAAIEAGLCAAGLHPSRVRLEVFPFEDPDPACPARRSNFLRDSQRSLAFTESFFRDGPGGRLTHMVAVERAGPSHLAPSHVSVDDSDIAIAAAEHENQVHSFRGEIITEFTAKTHLLFEFIRKNHLPTRTIGIGDGGNEIGMGSIPRDVLHRNIPGRLGARIACRIATDSTIACGVSNWGACALAAAVACLRGQPDLLQEWTDQRERTVLATLVDHGAVDGVTRKPSLSVDGLPFDQHLAIWQQIRLAAQAVDAMDAESNGIR